MLQKLLRTHKIVSPARKVESGHELLRIPIEMEDLSFDTCLARLRVRSNCSLLGFYPATPDGALAAEFVYPSNGRWIDVHVVLPAGTQSLAIRNATCANGKTSVEISSITYEQFGQIGGGGLSRLQQPAETAKAHIFLHTEGKTGSVSLENTLAKYDTVDCARIHFANLPNIARSNRLAAQNFLRGLTFTQFLQMRSTYSLVREWQNSPEGLDVICGIRRPEDLIVAALFQNFGNLFVTTGITPKEAAQHLINASAERLAKSEMWFLDEFLNFYGLDVTDFPRKLKKERSHWLISTNNTRIRFYRIEDGDAVLREVCEAVSGEPVSEVAHDNRSEDKPYNELYRATKEIVDYDLLRSKRPELLNLIASVFYD